MPRGGGGRGGGGSRGGGGFRGGGFRGGGASFRSSRGRTSGRPFGRTGARRTVTRSTRGPYRHRSYRRYGRHYRHWYYPYYRPWYRRWWYHPWWSGYYYRPWYYSPVYVGGGIIFIIIFALIALPLLGIAMAFPFGNADTSGVVNYRSTETLYYNEYWYEYENINQGNEITFSVQSSPSKISFAIWDQPFESFPLTTKSGSFSDQFLVHSDGYEYYSLYLKPGSTIDYDFNASNSIDFFIADGNNLNEWNSYKSYSFELEINSTMADSGSLLITASMGAKDYYLVWYNEEIAAVDVEFILNYTATDVIDLTEAEYYEEAVDIISETSITVPNDGNWYFFVYFDPMNSPEESTSVTFDVSYDTGVNSIDRWIDFRPILIIIGIIVCIVIIAAVLARRSQKKLKAKAPSKPSAKSPYVKVKPTPSVTCVRCGSELKPNDQFCRNCGGKREGRAVGGSSITTPAKSKICAYCGSKIPTKAKFCGVCGTKIGE